MQTITSKDGTPIAYDRLGSGPAVVLVCGASVTRGANAALAEVLAERFTVFNYDRRGRGDSGDTLPYAVEREFEDLDAVLTAAGGSAAVFGASSGAVLALRAAAHGLDMTKLALWEPPFSLDADGPRRQKEYATALGEHLAAGRPGDAAALFMQFVGLPAELIAQFRQSPMWPAMEGTAPSLAYDAAVMDDSAIPTAMAAAMTVPTLVLAGSGSPEFLTNAAQATVEAVPGARLHTLAGQDHNFDATVLGPVVAEFFAS